MMGRCSSLCCLHMQAEQLSHLPFWPRRPPMRPALGETSILASGARHWGHLVGTRRTCALSIRSRRCISPKSGLGDLRWRCSGASHCHRRWWIWRQGRFYPLAQLLLPRLSAPYQLYLPHPSLLHLHLLHLYPRHQLPRPQLPQHRRSTCCKPQRLM